MRLVLDASVAGAWCLSEQIPFADAVLARLAHIRGFVPALFWFEVRNLLLMNERRGRIAASDAADALGRLDETAISIDRQPSGERLMALARKHRLSAYDAAYLELAERLGAPLATLDSALAAAATAEGVPLAGG
jgi:predicted nucleic acid-binding protein